MLRITKNSKFIVLLITFLIVTSCDNKRVFDEYTNISNNNWRIDTPVLFQFEVQDTIAKRNLFINLRNNNNYAFSNLFLITKMSFPDGQKIIDTLEYDMADKTGRFLGKGFTEVKENKLFYKENIRFPKKGKYEVEISHAMRKNGEVEGVDALQGISDIGFRIEKIKK